jgi:MFS family permease
LRRFEERTVTETTKVSNAYAFYVAIVLCIAQTLAVVDRYLVSVLLEPLRHDMHLTDTELGLLQGPSFVLCFALVSIPLGRVADVSNRRLLILGGILVWTGATLASGLADSFAHLFIARLIIGAGEAALIPAAMSLLVAYFPPHLLNRGVSITTSGGSLGRSTAFLGGGALLTIFTAMGVVSFPLIGPMKPWQALFIFFGLLGFVVAALILTIREPTRDSASAAKGSFGEAIAYFWLHKGAFIPLFIAFSMVALVVQVLAGWAISFFVREHHMAPGNASILLGICSIGVGPFGNLVGGWLTDRLSAKGVQAPQLVVLTGILLGTILFGIAFWLSPLPPLAAVSYIALYFCASMCSAPGYAGVQVLTPDAHRGVMASLFLSTHILIGAGLGPLLVGFLSDLALPSLGASIFCAILLAAAGGIPCALLGRRAFEASRAIRFGQAQSGGH